MKTKTNVTLIDRLRARLRELRDANGANVTVTFALATVPMIGFVGASIDYSHANSVKAAMQAAADSTALMLSKNAATMSSSDLQTKGNAYFKALFNRPEATGLVVNINYSTANGSKVVVNATADVKADFMKLMGFQTMKVAVDSMARWGTTKMQIALALDVTGSMDSDGKMPALKTATKNLLTTLQSAATTNGDVRVAIIPFAEHVNVGSSNYNQSWIDWTDWDDDNGKDTTTTTCSTQKTGKSGKSKKKCSTSTTWVPDNHNTWNGCITDRDKDFDVKNTTPNPADVSLPPGQASTMFPAEQSDSCPTSLMGLSYDWTALKNKVDQLQPNGYTNQPIGLAWAWMALTPGAPLNPPVKSADTQQAIILFSDGMNTRDRWYQTQQPIDNRQALLCANAKAAGITIYTVLVNAGFSQVMKDCASKPEFYFEITGANQTIAAFNAIGTSLTKLRLAE
jgi:Flp pilus assembly protein TadG